MLKRILDELEERVSPEDQKKIRERHIKALNWETLEKLPLAFTYPIPTDFLEDRAGRELNPAQVSFEGDSNSLNWIYPPKEAFYNPEKMLINQLLIGFGSIYYHNQIRDSLPYTVRANFGTGIISSLFGAEIRFTDDNPPWASGDKRIEDYLEVDHLDFKRGICPRVLNRYKFYQEIFENYPKLKRSIAIVSPDLQGPLDVAEQLAGSRVYTEMIRDPELIERFLGKISQSIINFAQKVSQYTNEHLPRNYSQQHGVVIKGNILIREDSAINLSPKTYRKHVLPHDEMILKKLGGGGVHFCGDGRHLVPEMRKSSRIDCLDLGQPEMMDLNEIYQMAKEVKIPVLRARFPAQELTDPELQQKFPTGMTLRHSAGSLEEAVRINERYRND